MMLPDLAYLAALRVQAEAVRRTAQCRQIREIGQHHGAGTNRNSSSTQLCAVTPRACAV